MAVIVQPQHGHAGKGRAGEDRIAVPAVGVEPVGAKRPLGWAAQIKLVEFDAKGIDHAQSLRHGFGGMALGGASHAVVNFGKQNNIRCIACQKIGAFLRKEAALDVPSRDRDLWPQLRHSCGSAGLHR